MKRFFGLMLVVSLCLAASIVYAEVVAQVIKVEETAEGNLLIKVNYKEPFEVLGTETFIIKDTPGAVNKLKSDIKKRIKEVKAKQKTKKHDIGIGDIIKD